MHISPIRHHPLPDPSTTWDGLGSSIVGAILSGFISALVVVASILLAQRLKDASDERSSRREAANALLPALMNLRDAVLNTSARYSGRYPLWPLREALASTWHALNKTTAYAYVQAVYGACEDYRRWARAGGGAPDASPGSTNSEYDPQEDADAYLEAWGRNAAAALELLKGPLTDRGPAPPLAAYPVLPWFVPNPEEAPYDMD